MNQESPSIRLLPYPHNLPYDDLLIVVEHMARISTKIPGHRGEAFVRDRIRSKHYSVLRHAQIAVEISCSRCVLQELVTHWVGIARTASSTRWCNYSNDRFGSQLSFITPEALQHDEDFLRLQEQTEKTYLKLLEKGYRTDTAKYALLSSLKTEIGVTANVEAWRSIIQRRTESCVLEEFRHLMEEALDIFQQTYPVFFEDL